MAKICSGCMFGNEGSMTKCIVCGWLLDSPLRETTEVLSDTLAKFNKVYFNKDLDTAMERSRQTAEYDVGWGCSQCTFFNNGLLTKCEMCSVPRVFEPKEEEKEESPSVCKRCDKKAEVDELCASCHGKRTKKTPPPTQVPAPTRGKVTYLPDDGGETLMGAAGCPICGTFVDFCYFRRNTEDGKLVNQLHYLTNPTAPLKKHKWEPTCSALTCGDGRYTLTKDQAAELEKILFNTPQRFGCDAFGLKPLYVRKYLQKEEPESPYKKGDQIPAHLSPDLMKELGVSCGEFRVCLNEDDGPYTEMS